jgi:nitronate monooxygenase
MTAWPNKRFLDVLQIDLPIIQAPMAGASGAEMAIAVARAGGLGSLPCAILSIEQAHAEIAKFRAAGSWPLNLNFFEAANV